MVKDDQVWSRWSRIIKGGQDGQGLPKMVSVAQVRSGMEKEVQGWSMILIDTQGWSEMVKDIDMYSKMVRMFMDGT